MEIEAVTRTPASLPKNFRIRKRRDFLRAYDEGQKMFGRFVVLFMVENEFGHPRLGVTVTRKLGKATARNRAKRWVRELYRRHREESIGDLSIDLVVNVKPSTRDATFSEFSHDFTRTLKRAANARAAS